MLFSGDSRVSASRVHDLALFLLHMHTRTRAHTHTHTHTHTRTHTYTHEQFDADRNGHIDAKEIGAVLKSLNEDVPAYKIRDMIKEVDIDENGTVEFGEFIEVTTRDVKIGVSMVPINLSLV